MDNMKDYYYSLMFILDMSSEYHNWFGKPVNFEDNLQNEDNQ